MMLSLVLAAHALTLPSGEAAAWSEVLRTTGLRAAAPVTIERTEEGYRIEVATAEGRRVAVARGPHDTQTREDAARLAQSLLITGADPLGSFTMGHAAEAMPSARPRGRSAAQVVVPPMDGSAMRSNAEQVAFVAHVIPVPEPIAPAAAVEARPAAPIPESGSRRLVLGLGLRDELAASARLDGLSVTGRWATTATVGVELSIYGAWGAEGSSGGALAETLTSLGYPYAATRDVGAAELVADWCFVPLDGAWSGGPHLQLGPTLLYREDALYTPDGSGGFQTVTSTRVSGGVVAGLAVEGWYRARVGLRVRVLERLAIEQEPDYGAGDTSAAPTVISSGHLAADLMVRL